MTQTPQPPVELLHVDLGVTGMTCTSCSSRVERKLNKLDGVEATVNFATESASVAYDPDKLSPADLIQTVEDTGYGAFEMGASSSGDEDASKFYFFYPLINKLVIPFVFERKLYIFSYILPREKSWILEDHGGGKLIGVNLA